MAKEIRDTEDLCLALERGGASKGMRQLQFSNGAYVSTLLAYLRDNPGLIETMVEWIQDNDSVLDEIDEEKLIEDIGELLEGLKGDIGDEYRASEDLEDDESGMTVTIGTNDGIEWSYQTGDNSFTGNCYGKEHWGVVSLYRDSDCEELAREAVEQMLESLESI